MKKLLLPILICVSATTFAQDKKPPRSAYPEAKKLYNALDKVPSRLLLWEKTNQTQRVEAAKVATELRDQTTKLWGDFSQCTQAANSNLNLVIDINKIAFTSQSGRTLHPHEMLAALKGAERFGNQRAACYDEVESLDESVKK